jgi:hypothetical protein
MKRISILEMKEHSWLKNSIELKKYDNNKFINFIHNPDMKTKNYENELLKIDHNKKVKHSNSFLGQFNSVSEAEEMTPKQMRELREIKKKREKELSFKN